MRRFGMVVYGCALFLAGCEQDVATTNPTGDAPAVEHEMTLLAEASPEPGRTVKFYEAFEGAIVLGQTFSFGAQPLKVPEGMPVAEFFHRLAGKPAPQALVDADSRQQRMVAAGAKARPTQAPVRPTPIATPPAETSNGDPEFLYAVDDQYTATRFQSEYCWWGVCDYLKTAPFERKAYDVHWGEMAACAYAGTQLLTGGYHVWWGSWTSLGYVAFSAGNCASFTPTTSTNFDFDFAASVRKSGTSPMGYHFWFGAE